MPASSDALATTLASGVEEWSSAASLVPSLLEVAGPLEPLLGEPGLRRGALYTVTASRSLALSLVATTSSRSWCAIVGVPGLGLAAAQEAGVCLDRLVLVPSPGGRWLEVVSTLVDGFDVVLLQHTGALTPAVVRRLRARARQQGTVLVLVCEREPDVDDAHLRLTVVGGHWEGIADGHGHLTARRVDVQVRGRGAASRPRVVSLWLPAAGGSVDVSSNDRGRVRRLSPVGSAAGAGGGVA